MSQDGMNIIGAEELQPDSGAEAIEGAEVTEEQIEAKLDEAAEEIKRVIEEAHRKADELRKAA